MYGNRLQMLGATKSHGIFYPIGYKVLLLSLIPECSPGLWQHNRPPHLPLPDGNTYILSPAR